MKKQYLFVTLLCAGAVSLAVQSGKPKTTIQKYHHRFSSGSPAGRTGAPGESNCTSCHNGAAIAGSAENVLVVTESGVPVTNYVPGVTYQVSLAMQSNPAKKGFQTIVLNASNTFAGNFAAINQGATVINGSSGKKYMNHTLQGTNGGTYPTWDFDWTAPATDQGTVTFYVATNKANGNGQDGGDTIHLSQHTLGTTAGAKELNSTVSNFTARFIKTQNAIALKFNSLIAGSTYVNLIDLTGKSVLNTEFEAAVVGANEQIFRVPGHIKSGRYIVHFFVNNNAQSKMIEIY